MVFWPDSVCDGPRSASRSKTIIDVMEQTCSAGVSAQCGRSLESGHRRRAAHPLHHSQFIMLSARGARAGRGGILEPGGSWGKCWRRGGGRWGGTKECDVDCISARLLLENGELREDRKTEKVKTAMWLVPFSITANKVTFLCLWGQQHCCY